MKGRALQRGKPLKSFCGKAVISKNEYGETDNRCFCLGLIDCQTDFYLEECIKCGAFADNAEPSEVKE